MTTPVFDINNWNRMFNKRKNGSGYSNSYVDSSKIAQRYQQRRTTQSSVFFKPNVGRSYYRRRTRSSGNVYRRSNRYVGSTRLYGLPRARGPAARVNYGTPEVKADDTQIAALPISYGNVNGTFTWTGADDSIYTKWNGTNTAGAMFVLNAIAPGSGLAQRIGRQVNNRSLLIGATWRLRSKDGDEDPINSTEAVAIRTMVVLDKQPNNIFPAISDILSPVRHVANDYPMPISPNNLAFRDRFVTIWDAHDTLSGAGDNVRQYDKYIRLSGKTTFSSSTTGDEAIATGAYYIILLTDQKDSGDPIPIQNRPMFNAHIRFRFTDQ